MKIKKRIIALNIGILAVMLFSFITIWAVGDHYPLHTRTFFGTHELPQAVVSVGDDSVLRVENVRLENDELVVDFEALGPGSTRVYISHLTIDGYTGPEKFTLQVNAFHTIFDTTYGTVNFNGFFAVIIAILLLMVMIEGIMVWMFVDYCRKGEFCYPMIACGGVALYTLILLMYLVYYLLNNALFSFSYFIVMVNKEGMILLLALAPPMLLLSVLLAFSNIWLIRHEGFRPVNCLGVIFAVLWFIGAAATLGVRLYPYLNGLPIYNEIITPVIYVIGYLECMFLSTAVCSFLATKYKPPFDRDYIIILGCAIRRDGSLTPLLKARVDSAAAFEREQFEKSGRHAVFVPSGGQGSDELISEAEAMERYLLELGVPPERIAREDKSTNTYQNMQFSKQVIDAQKKSGEGNIAFATTNYHVFRGYILSRKLGFIAKGISAKTKPYFYPNAFLREFVGLLVDQKWKHVVFIVLTAAFFTLLSFA